MIPRGLLSLTPTLTVTLSWWIASLGIVARYPCNNAISQFAGYGLRRVDTEQEQQRVAVGPGNAQFISIRQVASDAATLRRCTCGPALLLLLPQPLLQRCCC